MTKRILSTLALWSIVILCVTYFGSTGGVWLLTLISALTLREFFVMVRKMGLEPFNRLSLIFSTCITLAPLYLEPYLLLRAELFLAIAVVAFSIRILGERKAENRVESLAWSVFGLAYIPFMLHFLVRIMLLPGPHQATGLTLAIWLIAVSKFCDVGALLTGLAFGRHRMAPNISPKKTWEGAIGGIGTSALVGAGIVYWLPQCMPAHFTPLFAALVAIPVAAAAIVSDLIESVIKRRADMKDAGQAIPGIGGIFDLSDSLILTAPLGYAVFVLL